MNRRQFIAATFAAGGSLGLGWARSAQAQTTLKFASATLNDVQHHYQKLFKEKLEAAAGGEIVVELYPASQLGPIPRMVEGVMFGAVESFITATAFLSQVDPRFQAFDVASLFRDPAIAKKLLASAPFRERARRYGDARNVEAISTFVHSPNTLISKAPIRSLADFDGLKIRVLGTPFQIEPMRALGATPVPMPLSEVMPALQTGAIDAVISAPTVAAAFRYYDAAKHMMTIDSWPLIVTVATSRAWLQGLSPDLRDQVVTTALETEAEAVAWGEADVIRATKTWADNGGQVETVTPALNDALQGTIATSTAGLVDGTPPIKAEVDALQAIASTLT